MRMRAVEYPLASGESVELNLGGGTGTTVKELLTAIADVSGREFNVNNVDRREGDSTTLMANNDKARDIFGWLPKYDLSDTTRSVWNWHSRKSLGGRPAEASTYFPLIEGMMLPCQQRSE